MAMALVRKMRSPLSLAGSVGACTRVWNAPAPTRYRFAIQAAGDKALFKPNPLLDAKWTASAWIWAPLTTAAADTKPWSGRPGEEAMWAALLDIRKFAQRVDNQGVLHGAQLEQIFQLIKDMPKGYAGKGWRFYLLAAALIYAIVWLSNYMTRKSTSQTLLHEFLVTTVNKVVTDPETQQNFKMSAIMAADAAGDRLNPLSRVKGLFSGGVEVEEDCMSYTDLVAKDAYLGLHILLIIQVNLRNGTTFDDIMKDLSTIVKEDPIRVMEMIQLLKTVGYIDVQETMFPGEKKPKKTYWPGKAALLDSTSGVLEKKLRSLVRMKKKAVQVDKEQGAKEK